MTKMINQNIAVWFSCGAASAVAAKLTVDKYGKNNNVVIINTPIKEEHPDNRRFLHDVEKWIDRKVKILTSKEFPDSSAKSVWEKRKFMSGPKSAPCTMLLKKAVRQEYEKQNKVDWHVFGFTRDEINRHRRFILTERDNVIPVLINNNITKYDCYHIIKSAWIKLPKIYSMGYPNANCIGCVKATSPTYWNHVRKMHPEVFQDRALQSREIGCKLTRVKGKRIYLDELKVTDKGSAMKNVDFECGIFCEEI